MPNNKTNPLQVDPLVLQEIGRLQMELAVSQRRANELAGEVQRLRAKLAETEAAPEGDGKESADA